MATVLQPPIGLYVPPAVALVKKPFRFTLTQQEAIRLLCGDATKVQMEGGSRAGKTFVIIRQTFKYLIENPGLRAVSLRLHRNSAIESLWMDTVPKVIELCFPGLKGFCKPNNSLGYRKLWNGSEYWCGGLDDKDRVDKILGREFGIVHFNETSQIPYDTILRVRTRLAQKIVGPDGVPFRNREWHDLNPVGKMHWSHKVFHELKDPLQPEKEFDAAIYARMLMRPQDNLENLDQEYIDSLDAMPAGLRARFFLGEYQDEMIGALWTLSMLAASAGTACTYETMPVKMRRVVIGVDPSGDSGDLDSKADAIGIVVAGMGVDDRAYVLEDATMNGSPEQWGRRVNDLRLKWHADKIIAERNYGGAMVEAVIRHAFPNSPVELVTSSHGKALRAEPVSVMYEIRDGRNGAKVIHCGHFPDLAQEMMSVKRGDTAEEIKARLGHSPNRLDALVFGLTSLFELSNHGIFEVWKKEAEKASAAAAKPEAIGAKVEDNEPIPVKEQHTAAKSEIPWFQATAARETKTFDKPRCDQCGNENPRVFTDVWQCHCGATGHIYNERQARGDG